MGWGCRFGSDVQVKKKNPRCGSGSKLLPTWWRDREGSDCLRRDYMGDHRLALCTHREGMVREREEGQVEEERESGVLIGEGHDGPKLYSTITSLSLSLYIYISALII